ncbi:MAG: metallophosphoesterase [Saprospiraceae bacterium]
MRFNLFLLVLILISSCKKEEKALEIIFLGHPYDWMSEGKRIDPRLEKINYDSLDMIWLGGDVCARLTKDKETLEYVDSLFDFDSGKVHWAWGNHDLVYGNTDYLIEKTGKPGFYFDKIGHLGILVLNTNIFFFPGGEPTPERCAEKEQQLDLIKSLLDSTSEISNLVVLHHHCLLTKNLSGNTLHPDSIFNEAHPEYWVSCESRGTFEEVYYPLFKKIKDKGVEVVFIGGDVGMHAKKLEYKNPDGIWFLGSGINNSVDKRYLPDYVWTTAPDEILYLKYFPESGKLTWDFRLLGGD